MPEDKRPVVDQRVINLYDEYTHKPLERRVFMQRLAELVGGVAAASVLVPLLENNYAQAAIIEPNDRRLETGYLSYPGQSGNVRAYFAKPLGGPPKLPMVLVVHENRGLNPHIEDVARRAAFDGFFAMAPDFLSALGGTPADEEAARQLFGKLTRPVALGDAVAGVDYLASRPDSSGKIGAVGFCWGGGMVNRLAAGSSKLIAAVPFYGDVPDAADVPKIKARMLLHYASQDSRINAGIPSFEAALKAAGVPYTLHMYEGVNHAFHNDTNSARYDKQAAELAWRRTMAFFRQHLA
jgi:carboxymethylenebutenolidase